MSANDTRSRYASSVRGRRGTVPDLSVVVASVESARSMEAFLGSIDAACAGLDAEVFVVDASRDESAALAESFGGAHVLRHPPGTVVPVLWAEGIRQSKGRYVALTTGHCLLPPGWGRELSSALRDGAAAAGAGLRPNRGISATDAAVFHLRYGGFIPLTRGPRRPVEDLPGDNVCYHGNEVRRYMEAHSEEGFWEIDYHREIRRRGGRLVAVPEATAGFGPSCPFITILRHRFEHGRQHGGYRVVEERQPRWRVFLPAPLVPIVLLARRARPALADREHRASFLAGVVPFLALGSAWAAGEAAGALAASRREGRP